MPVAADRLSVHSSGQPVEVGVGEGGPLGFACPPKAGLGAPATWIVRNMLSAQSRNVADESSFLAL